MKTFLFAAAVAASVLSVHAAPGPRLQWLRDIPQGGNVRQIVDQQKNLWIAMASSLGDNSDIALLKFDRMGNRLWNSQFDNGDGLYDSPIGVGLDAAGSFYVAGYGGFPRDFTAIKYAADGAFEWSHRYAGPGSSDDIPSSMAVDRNGVLHIVGSEMLNGSSGGLPSAVLVSWNSDGAQFPAVHYTTTYTFAVAVAADSQGSPAYGILHPWEEAVYINGARYPGWAPILLKFDAQDQLVAGFARGSDFVIVKHTSDGNPAWTRQLPGGSSSQYAMRLDSQSAVIVMESHSQDDGSFTRISKLTPAGRHAWTRTFQDAFASLEAIDVDENDNILLGVTATGIYPPREGRLISIRPNGRVEWNVPVPGGNEVEALTSDSAGRFYVTGSGYVAQYARKSRAR